MPALPSIVAGTKMSKIANVVFPYSPNNDDELELAVGDRIEVIGIEEEGWWKGNLRGRVGVFPSNFVQIIEAEPPTSAAQNINKLNSLFGSRVGSKNSLSSSNSLSNINSNSNNNLNINNSISTSASNNNLIMNNTLPQQQQQDINSTNEFPFASAEESMHSNNSLGERRPKPLRGIGYGDIFAQGAKTRLQPVDPTARVSTALTSDRLSASGVAGLPDSNTIGRMSSATLPKSIPKKPPPPAPADANGPNGSAPDQAPALPPKPSNQFSPFLHKRPLPNPTATHRNVREQARVIYAYKPTNDDELEMEVGDIIDIIEKKIEDAGWWRGELNGKIGVFPDNFVTLLNAHESPSVENSSRLSGSANSMNSSGGGSGGGISHHHQQSSATSTEGMIKSVFVGTPKGFSKELESNLEKHSGSGAFLSPKRSSSNNNKITHQLPSSINSEQANSMMTLGNIDSTSGPSNTILSDANMRQNGHTMSNYDSSSPGKLNHMTANRAKGPTRRPPSSVMNRRNQLNELTSSIKYETAHDLNEDLTPASLPAFKQTSPFQPQNNHGLSTCQPNEKQQPQQATTLNANPLPHGTSNPKQNSNDPASPPSKTRSPLSNNGGGENSQSITPKTSQRISQTAVTGQQQQPDETTSRSNPTSDPATPPPWLVVLRKTNAEKKRDPLPASPPSLDEETSTPAVPSIPPLNESTVPSTNSSAIISSTPIAPAATPCLKNGLTNATRTPGNEIDSPKSDDILNQISDTVTKEMSELRNDVKKLQEDFKSILGLKDAIETMKTELKTCQSATESQRKYIKELVNNLADERKKIATMQTEIDRNLK